MQNKIFIVSGATASGKTFLAIKLAQKYNAVVLNADSMQIYNGLPILSAQPNQDELKQCEHRLYGVLHIDESNSVFNWLNMIKKESENILKQNKNIVIVGGTGMYITRLIDGLTDLPSTDENLRNELNNLYSQIGWDKFYKMVKDIDEESVNKIAKNDKQRLIRIYEVYMISNEKMSVLLKKNKKNTLFDRKNIFHININLDRNVLYKRCELRFYKMVENDIAIDEVKRFIDNNRNYIENHKDSKIPIFSTIGFREIQQYLRGGITKADAIEQSIKSTKNYAKRQYTWFNNQFKNVDFSIENILNEDNCNVCLNIINNKFLQI